jgi:hypothetical protein
MPLVETSQPFCANSLCPLHVCVGDPGVEGTGNWAELDGHLIGRGRYDGRMLCDPCGHELVAAAGDAMKPLHHEGPA